MLEKYLTEGEIHIGCYSDGLLFSYFISHNKERNFFSQSQRGVRYLLLSLEAEILQNKSLQEEADKKYPYPLAVGQTDSVEHFLINKYIHLFVLDGSVCSTAYQVVMPTIKGIPGMYSRSAKGDTIEQAIQNLLLEEPQRILAFGGK